MTREEWVQAFCDETGVEPPSPKERGALLRLAWIAAHDSERPAAPLACWAAGRSGRSAAELHEIATGIAAAQATPSVPGVTWVRPRRVKPASVIPRAFASSIANELGAPTPTSIGAPATAAF